jgi:1-acyl-sn-glycerol-3-phosphate acyltransferase
MSLSRSLLVALFRGVTSSIFRIHDEALARVPARGPLIIVGNHVELLEIPLLYARLQPRRMRGLVLAERWKTPLLAWMLNTVEAIPLERGGINFNSINNAVDVLKAGEILAVMPEGTRSHNGCLQAGHSGVVLLALKGKAPILPLVSYGGEKVGDNLKRFRRTDFFINVGEPFKLNYEGNQANSQERAQMLDEIMYRMAALLPPEYRGVYANLPAGYQKTISCPEETRVQSA